MLCLSRKLGQRLIIGNNIAVTVNRIAGGRVVLGVEAPADVKVIRSELGGGEEIKKDEPRCRGK